MKRELMSMYPIRKSQSPHAFPKSKLPFKLFVATAWLANPNIRGHNKRLHLRKVGPP